MANRNQLKITTASTTFQIFFLAGSLLLAGIILVPPAPEPTSADRQSTPPAELETGSTYSWEDILQNYPDYPDAYLHAAWKSLQKNEPHQALHYLQLAQQLAPNHPLLENMEKLVFLKISQIP